MDDVFIIDKMGSTPMNYEEQYVSAIVRLISHCGLRFLDILKLQKSDFDFENMCIHGKREKTNHMRKVTIRPDDESFFKEWFSSEDNQLFTFSERTYQYSLRRFAIPSQYTLREQLKTQMIKLHAKSALIATKLGYFVSYTDEQSSLFESLLQFEQKHFGDKN
jgi:integrase